MPDIVLKLNDKKRFELYIGTLQLSCSNEYPVTYNIFKGIIDWFRNGSASIHFNTLSNRSIYIVLSVENSYAIEDDYWPRFQMLNVTTKEIINAFLKSLSENTEDWAHFETNSEEEYKVCLECFKELLSLIELYDRCYNNHDWGIWEKAERMFSEVFTKNIKRNLERKVL